MDMLETAIGMMKQGCYMASVDLEDAYYMVPIDASSKNIWSSVLKKSIFSTLVFPTVCLVLPVFLLCCWNPFNYSAMRGAGTSTIPRSYLQVIACVVLRNGVTDIAPFFSDAVVMPSGNPGHLNFWKISVQIPPHRAEKLFKGPTPGKITRLLF